MSEEHSYTFIRKHAKFPSSAGHPHSISHSPRPGKARHKQADEDKAGHRGARGNGGGVGVVGQGQQHGGGYLQAAAAVTVAAPHSACASA